MTKVISPFDLASYSQIPALTNSSPATNDIRGTAFSTTGWGAIKYDSTLLFINKPKLITLFDLSSYSQIPALTNSSPASSDIRSVSFGTTGWGAIEYNGSLTDAITYSRGVSGSLPTDDTDLSTVYSATDITNVATKDAIRVTESGSSQYMIHQFKNYAGTSTSTSLEWYGQSDLATTSATIYLQIYNRSTSTWDTKDTDSATAANTDIDLTATVTPLTNYKSLDNVISCRVYQQAP